MTPRSINNSIVLNETENDIRNLLMEFCNHHNEMNQCHQLILRITGGWVRDKLLGNESNDLDIAINNLSGEEFVTKLTSYLDENHPELSLKAIHTIKKNPEKSKHLETCTAKIYGLDIDFVNLRSEKYSEDSRIPIIEYGTAEEDALRRDATLNALFYNLNDKTIEDFTNKGLNDLKEGILRTPLTPLSTFLDDPLRVLRLIRFASRFNFIIEHETLDAMKNSEIKSSLLHKISRERIGVELDKILNSPNPEYGLKLLNYVSIAESVFNLDTIKQQLVKFNQENVDLDLALDNKLSPQIYASTLIAPSFRSSLKTATNGLSASFNNVTPKLFWLSIILAPFRNFPLQNVTSKVLNEYYIPRYILKEGLKFGKHDFEIIAKILSQLDNSKPLINKVVDGTIKRSEFGLYLRDFGSFVDLNLIVNCFDEILQSINLPVYSDVPQPNDEAKFDDQVAHTITSIIDKYNKVINQIHEFNLTEVSKLKPILDGKTISKTLNKKPGPWMAKVTHEVLVWQLDHPQGTSNECFDHINQIL